MNKDQKNHLSSSKSEQQFQLEANIEWVPDKSLPGGRRILSLTHYHDNGAVKTEFFFKKFEADKEEFVLKSYYDNGQLIFQTNCIKDKTIDDKIIYYYKNGNVKCDISYKNGIMHGLAKGYYMGGKIAMEIIWDNAQAVDGVYYKKSGIKKIMTKQQLTKITKAHNK
jgi:antitoxin component YwqK of YwqJK toxin-antitoxin module